MRRALLLSSIVVTMLAFGAPAASAGGCPNADLAPQNAAEAEKAEEATRCLVNRERRKRGRRALRFNNDLLESADWQAQDMINHGYFGHDRSNGPSFTGRITRFGYGDNSNGYSLGENLAWASCDGASAREMVRMWLGSPGHRSNMLNKRFKEQAVSAVWVDGNQVGGEYAGAGPLLIYVNQFGARY
ncbi:MAG: CAP domain-containing protein [Solirubrobacterales bacterium]